MVILLILALELDVNSPAVSYKPKHYLCNVMKKLQDKRVLMYVYVPGFIFCLGGLVTSGDILANSGDGSR